MANAVPIKVAAVPIKVAAVPIEVAPVPIKVPVAGKEEFKLESFEYEKEEHWLILIKNHLELLEKRLKYLGRPKFG